ncbi:hypothetical protein C0995_008405, partial [Termitomyces sp. Mi166
TIPPPPNQILDSLTSATLIQDLINEMLFLTVLGHNGPRHFKCARRKQQIIISLVRRK